MYVTARSKNDFIKGLTNMDLFISSTKYPTRQLSSSYKQTDAVYTIDHRAQWESWVIESVPGTTQVFYMRNYHWTYLKCPTTNSACFYSDIPDVTTTLFYFLYEPDGKFCIRNFYTVKFLASDKDGKVYQTDKCGEEGRWDIVIDEEVDYIDIDFNLQGA